MTIEEAIAHAKEQTEIFAGKHRVFLYLAIEALEKQIPNKPYDVDEKGNDDFYYLGFMCPSCNEAVVWQPYRPKFCKHCGQAIDWSGENVN